MDRQGPALPAGRHPCIVLICMVVFTFNYVLMGTHTGIWYEAVHIRSTEQIQEKQTLSRLQKYFHQCSINSNCNYVVEDMSNGVRMYNTWSEIPFEELPGIWMKMLRRYVYKAFVEKLTWNGARAKCQSHGGDLASIINKQDEEKIKDLLSAFPNSTFFWCGLNDIEEEGKYVWSDGSEFNYANWDNVSDPNNYNNEDCMVTKPSLKWYDAACNNRAYLICKTLVYI